MATQQTSTHQAWLKDTERCVMCGLCLPHCPTYTLFKNEGDAPRGRILLVKALIQSTIPTEPKLLEHLNTCLGCRQCERVCPAHVPFQKIMDQARTYLATTTPKLYKPWQLPIALRLFSKHRRLRRLFGNLLALYHRSQFRRLLQNTLLKHLQLVQLDAMLPNAFPKIRRKRQCPTTTDNTVALFSGCAGEVLDRESLHASKQLLQDAGYEVYIPQQQNCCGALHQHNGNRQASQQLLAQNKRAFKRSAHVVSCASGCGMQLDEHAEYLGIRHTDIHDALLTAPQRIYFKECNMAVSLHTPCTMHSSGMERLLRRIPGLYIKKLCGGNCCGFAAAHFFTQRHTAERLLAPLLGELATHNTSILLTSNIGCMLHFRQGIVQSKLNMKVMHPSVFLYQQRML